MDQVNQLIAALRAALNALKDPREAMTDLAAVNCSEATKGAARTYVQHIDARRRVLDEALRALEALLAQGYPAAITVDSTDEVASDAAEQARTMAIAATLLQPAQAAKVGVKFSAPVPKG